MARRVVFLESLHGIESLFTRGLRSGAMAEGWEVEVLFLRGVDKAPLPEAELRRRLQALRPDRICFLMDAPLACPTLWDDPVLRAIPKASFWFDDFLRSAETLRSPGVWKQWQLEAGVRVFFHDGHWREAWEKHAGGAAHPIALSADAAIALQPGESFYPELADHAVMIGTIPALDSLEAEAAAFAPSIRQWIARTVEAMETAPWPIRAYDLADDTLRTLSAKGQAVIGRWLEDPAARALANLHIWRLGKRAARLRGLRALAQRVPVAVLSGHGQERFAQEEELRREIAPAHGFAFRDTTGLPAAQWGGLFRSGRLQVQWVDPQSIESGAPFRLFETAAAGVALLSDARPGFPALFAPDREMFYAPNEMALAERAAELMAGRAEVLEITGQRAREAFLSRHTWAHRWREIGAKMSAAAGS